jgi:hypothetical protein
MHALLPMLNPPKYHPSVNSILNFRNEAKAKDFERIETNLSGQIFTLCRGV